MPPHPVFNKALFLMAQFFFALGGPHAEIYSPSDWGKRASTCLQRMIESIQAIADFFDDLERQHGKEIAEAMPHVPPATTEDVKNAATAAEKVYTKVETTAKEAENEVIAEMRITAADVKDHTTAETAAAVAEVRRGGDSPRDGGDSPRVIRGTTISTGTGPNLNRDRPQSQQGQAPVSCIVPPRHSAVPNAPGRRRFACCR